jgi:hypothetical protein
MKQITLFALLLTIALSLKAFALKEETHESINNEIGRRNINGFSLDAYVMNRLGFLKGADEDLSGIDADGINRKKSILWWLGHGGFQEDRPGEWYHYLPLVGKPTRSVNHFHNPLKPWNEAGLDDKILGILSYKGQSQVLWAQNTNQNVGGKWSWQDARRYFYDGLTSKTKSGRDKNFADNFRAVGQLMHLVHDASVPEHVRNDAHAIPAYEAEVESIRLKHGDVWRSWINSPISFDKAILDIPPTHAAASVPISRIVDSDKYTGDNPNITATLFNLPQPIGIAEYTNANFLSNDTMFESETRHHFHYPRVTDTVIWTGKNKKRYVKKNGNGDAIDHLATISKLWEYRMRYFPQYAKYYPLILDGECYKEYAEKLIPRAVGYSAGLLNYFFRGDIRLEYITTPEPGYLVVNNTGEKMEGDFTIYYDTVNDDRYPIWAGRGTLEATIGDKTNTFNFIPPGDAKEPGKYIVVFKGKMGNEDGAVAGYVLQRRLEITPPDQFIYSMVDADQPDPYFTSIKAKVKNANPSEAIQNGFIQAIAKYKTDIDDADFSYSMSAPQSISSLASDQATEFEFNFSNDPIPVDVTDLYLQVIFKGAIGNESNAVAIGLKDISEPTPIDVFNNMDRACLYGSWYAAGSQEAITAVDTDATIGNHNGKTDEWDVYAHNVKDIYIKFSPSDKPENASSAHFDFYVESLPAGQFKRALYILTDYKFSYSFYDKWLPVSGEQDPWVHVDEIFTHQGTAVKNQTDLISDTQQCGNEIPCLHTTTASYYSYRGSEMWWGGGLIYVNRAYPEGSSCP